MFPPPRCSVHETIFLSSSMISIRLKPRTKGFIMQKGSPASIVSDYLSKWLKQFGKKLQYNSLCFYPSVLHPFQNYAVFHRQSHKLWSDFTNVLSQRSGTYTFDKVKILYHFLRSGSNFLISYSLRSVLVEGKENQLQHSHQSSILLFQDSYAWFIKISWPRTEDKFSWFSATTTGSRQVRTSQ